MAGKLLLRAALCAVLGRAEMIKIILDTLISPHTTQSAPWGLSYIEVSDQITAADLVEQANFYGKVHYDDWDYHRYVPRKEWGSDNGDFLNYAYQNTVNGPYGKVFSKAFYAGKMMRPTSTLRSNGVRTMSTVLLLRNNEDGAQVRISTGMVYFKVTFNGRNEYMYFYRREDKWNLVNFLSHRYGLKAEDAKIEIFGKGTFTPSLSNPTAGDFLMTGKMKDDSGKNPVPITVLRTKACKCLNPVSYNALANEHMTKRLIADKYGLQCAAHDSSTKTCNKKNIKKGNRECWCPRKWCYVEAGCGAPSAKFPGMSFSYDICQNNNAVDCFASDTEGVEAAQLSDFDIWTFPKVTGYLRRLAAVLVDAVPSLSSKFADEED